MVSGLTCITSALFRLAFASAPRLPLNLAMQLNSPVHSSIGTLSHIYRASSACRHTVSGSFHSPSGVLFTFPSRYYSLSVAKEYFALEGGPPCFPQGSSCPVVLWIPARLPGFRLLEFHRLCLTFPGHSTILFPLSAGPQPRMTEVVRFGLCPFRSPLLRVSRLSTFPPAT